MGSEILAVPEESLQEVINVIREGLMSGTCSEDVAVYLEEWCDTEEEYLNGN